MTTSGWSIGQAGAAQAGWERGRKKTGEKDAVACSVSFAAGVAVVAGVAGPLLIRCSREKKIELRIQQQVLNQANREREKDQRPDSATITSTKRHGRTKP